MISDVGFNDVISTIYDKYGYIAIGTGDSPVDPTDNSLETELERLIAIKSKSTTTRTDDTITWYTDFELLSDVTLNEFGLFSASSGGDMFLRGVHPVIVKGGYHLRITFGVVMSETYD